jgi:hypothetical protein
MSQYGELIGAYEPDKELVYSGFVEYFENPTMTKYKDDGIYSIYMSKMYCLLSNECRYLVSIVEKDRNEIGSEVSLDGMRWISFQTRTLADDRKLSSHSYIPRRGGILDCQIERHEITEDASKYRCEQFPRLEVTLLHTDKGSSEYQDRGVIITALETYQTVISFKTVALK